MRWGALPEGHRIGFLQGRVGKAVKVREIFVYPRQIEDLVNCTAGVLRVQAVVTRLKVREEIAVTLVARPGADLACVDAQIRPNFRDLSRLRPDRVCLAEAAAFPSDSPPVVHELDGVSRS